MTCTHPTGMEPLHRCSPTLMTKTNDNRTHQQLKSIPTNLSNATIHHMSLVVDPGLYWFQQESRLQCTSEGTTIQRAVS